MKKVITVVALALMLPVVAFAATEKTVDPAELNLGFMNVFELPENGGGFVFGSPWGFADLTAVYAGSDLTLGPNSVNDPDPFWYIGGGGPGAPGNKIMDANSYAEVLDGSLAGDTVIFSGNVIAYSLTPSHVVKAFIRDFAPDFSSVNEATVELNGTGSFTVILDTLPDPGRPVQWGFQMVGVNVWITDVEPYGSITISPAGTISVDDTSFGSIKALYR